MRARFLDDLKANDREVRPFNMVCDARAAITYYKIPQTSWTDAEVNQRVDEAKRWFNRYCIHLDFESFALDLTKARDRRIKAVLDAIIPVYVARSQRISNSPTRPPESAYNDLQASLLSIDSALRRKVGRNRLVVIFLDEWYVLVGTSTNPNRWRQFRVSANDGSRLLVGITKYDRTSHHILTHELTHALRKDVRRRNGNMIRKFLRANTMRKPKKLRTWQDHYGGRNQDDVMSFTNRARFNQAFAKQSSDVLTLDEYLGILHGGYVMAADGCNCDKEKEEKREEEELR